MIEQIKELQAKQERIKTLMAKAQAQLEVSESTKKKLEKELKEQFDLEADQLADEIKDRTIRLQGIVDEFQKKLDAVNV